MDAWYFTEMPYPHIPPHDEIEAMRVSLPNAEFDPVLGGQLYNRYLDEYMLADELGLEIMVNEHHSTATSLTASANVILSILARITKRARLLVLGVPVANRPDPIRVAEEMAMIDVISGGRLELGMIKGVPYEIAPANSNPVGLMERYWEAHDLIVKALATHDGPFNFEGKYFHHRSVNIWPRAFQKPHPPIMIGGGGEKRTLKIAAKYADAWNVPFISPEAFAQKRAVLHEHCESIGRNPAELACAVNLGIAWTEESLRSQFGGLTEQVRPGVLTGSDEQVIDRIGQYVSAGADQVNLALRAPINVDDIERFAATFHLS